MERFANRSLCWAVLLLTLGAGALPLWAATKKKPVAHSTSSKTTSSKGPSPPLEDVPETGPLPAAMQLPVPVIPAGLTTLPLAARGAIVIDAVTGEALYEKNADSPQYPASTTKIMTALLVIENGDLDQQVEVTPEDAKVGESSLELHPGDHFTRREALFGLMLKSANDVAWALGRDNAGTMAAFAEKMTRRAEELGASNTHFANPHGLHDPHHYTTPRDLAQIARAAMQQPLFRQIVSTEFFSWSPPEREARELRNHNRLLFAFPGCTGVKTGYTSPAQQVLVSAAHWGTREVISVVMHTNKPGIWDDSKLLLTWGLERPLSPHIEEAYESHELERMGKEGGSTNDTNRHE